MLPIVVSLEINEAAMLRQRQAQSDKAANPIPTTSIPSSETINDTFTLDLCHMTDQYSPHEEMMLTANPIAAVITGWRNPCPPRWTVSGMLISTLWTPPTPASFARQQIVDVIFLILLVIQWLLMGGFPLRPHPGLLRDPAFFITAFTIAAAALSLIPQIGSVATIPSLFAFITWLWWLSLLAWKLLRSGWNGIADRMRDAAPKLE